MVGGFGGRSHEFVLPQDRGDQLNINWDVQATMTSSIKISLYYTYMYDDKKTHTQHIIINSNDPDISRPQIPFIHCPKKNVLKNPRVFREEKPPRKRILSTWICNKKPKLDATLQGGPEFFRGKKPPPCGRVAF